MSKTKSGIFYGWWIIIAAFIILVLTSGFCIYGFSLFVKPLITDLKFSRSLVMLGFTMFVLSTDLTSPFLGRMIEKKGAKIVLLIGAVSTGIGFLILSQVQSIVMLFLGDLLIGIGSGATGPLTASTLCAYWFKKKRGTATGFASAGAGVGGLVMAPLLGGWVIPTFGWRNTYMIMGIVFMAVIIPLAMFVVKTKPSEMGLYPDGDEAPAQGEAGPQVLPGLDQKTAMGTAAFWLLGSAIIVFSFAQMGMLQTQVPHLNDIGFNMGLAASALGVVGLMSALGKVIFGWLCDILPIKTATIIGFSLQLLGILLFISIGKDSSIVILYLYAVIFGLGMGSWMPLLSIQLTSNFGLRAFASIYGLIFMMKAIGDSAGPLAAASMFDLTGSYRTIFIIFAVCTGLSILLITMINRPKQMDI